MKKIVLIGCVILILGAHIWGAVHASLDLGSFMEIDSYAYVGLANNFAQTGKYIHPTDPDEDLYRPPVYPIFLFIIWKLSGESMATVPLVQTLLYFLGAYLLFLSGKTILGTRAGIAAALLYLVNLNSTFWSFKLLTESLSGFWLILAVHLMVRYWHSAQLRWVLLAGIVMGLGALTRPILFPLAWVWIGLFGLVAWQGRQPKNVTHRWWQPVMLLGLGVFAIITPWQLRNYATYQKYTVSTVGTHTLFAWNAARILEQAEGYSLTEAQTMVEQSENPLAYSLGLIQKYPGIAVKLQIRGILRTLLGAEYNTWSRTFTGDPAPQSGILTVLLGGGDISTWLRNFQTLLSSPWVWAGLAAVVYDGVLYFSCLLALVRSYRNRRQHRTAWCAAVWLGISISYLVLVPLAAGDSRFRVPADPLLALLASFVWMPNMVESLPSNKEISK